MRMGGGFCGFAGGELAHGADLSGRGVRAQQQLVVAILPASRLSAGGDVEGILHFARRVVRREVEQLEVHLIALHLPAGIDLEAHLGQNVQHKAQLLGGGVQPAHERTRVPAG